MTRERLAKLPEFLVLEAIAHSKRHQGKNLEIQQALVDLLAAFPSERKKICLRNEKGDLPLWPERPGWVAFVRGLKHQRYEMPGWVEALGEEVCG